ncbi:MAG TPA: glucose 1-dehydrogenase [Acidimicrobiales bacterium]|nr:glucose 1-dehydrogenase [Acidimicrobiales bacterium]
MSGQLEGKVAVVTGSSSGIGAAAARLMAAEGARIVVNSVTSVAAGEALAAELPDASYVQADIADESQAHALVAATLERYGRLDILVNNAGATRVIPHHDLAAVTDEDWQRILGTNVVGTWYVTRAAVDALRADGGGCVINVTSIAGVRPTGSSIPYAVSKAALNHLTVLLANILGPEIRVNAVAPGLVDTPWTADWGPVKEMWAGRAPLRRTGTPEDVARVCLTLATADWMTGEVVLVDGGMHLR